MKYYPGGDDFQSYLDFIRGIFKELEHPYRTNDLNFRIRMIAHSRQFLDVLFQLIFQNLDGKHLKDPHDALDLLTVFVNPNDTPYAVGQDQIFENIGDGFIKKKLFLCRYKFIYKDSKIYIQKQGVAPVPEYPIEDFHTLPEDEQKFIIHYMKFIANMADLNVMPWLKPRCIGDDNLPLLEFVTNKNIAYRLSSEFLNTILKSFDNASRSWMITSNSFHSVFSPQNNIKDNFWEADVKDVKEQVTTLYPIMIERSQSIESMHSNISFEIQKMRFFNAMLKHNLLFENELDPTEWIPKVFDHCNKMILLVLSQYAAEEQTKKKQRTYEVTESYPQDYTSQKSVYELHFWYRKATTLGTDLFNEYGDDTNQDTDKGYEKLDKETIKTIITEAIGTFHFLVEIRHKYLCACINDELHDKIWNGGLKDYKDDFIDSEKAYEYTQLIGKLVLDSVEAHDLKMKNYKHIPPIPELFEQYIHETLTDPTVSKCLHKSLFLL